MMRTSIILLFTFTLIACNSQQSSSDASSDAETSKEQQNLAHATSEDDSKTRVGEISAQELITQYTKFSKSYQQYEVDADESRHFAKLKDMEVIVFFGLWCHDSQREVPRLIKLIEASGSPFKSIKLIALNTEKELPDEYQAQFTVTHTPTIFILQNNQILASVVEKPKLTIAKDILGQIFH
ncbi:thioredoxin family protein [Aliikangiella coralliicola]|uniref:Thioredoxin family protein n=1 Tax=Aliikangiella coralliicola TaxID=2592383 RepID=A0A545UFA4_9GAMM|nr:thioredoxin family protein [Aliikangiella coralliicola]TQV88149.1 thioredoxin family protein [Aliikangiella coralliicola]